MVVRLLPVFVYLPIDETYYTFQLLNHQQIIISTLNS